MPREPKRIEVISGHRSFLQWLHDAFDMEEVPGNDIALTTYNRAERVHAMLGSYRPHVIVVTRDLDGVLSGPAFVRAVQPDHRQHMSIIGVYGLQLYDRACWDGVPLDGLLPGVSGPDIRDLVNRIMTLSIAVASHA